MERVEMRNTLIAVVLLLTACGGDVSNESSGAWRVSCSTGHHRVHASFESRPTWNPELKMWSDGVNALWISDNDDIDYCELEKLK